MFVNKRHAFDFMNKNLFNGILFASFPLKSLLLDSMGVRKSGIRLMTNSKQTARPFCK